MMKRWNIARIVLALALVIILLPSAWAKDEFPSRPITLLCGFAPGGSADIQARLLAELISKDLGERVVVEHKPGMMAGLMHNYLVRQKPDGYTIATTPTSSLIANHFMMKVEYSHKDLTYIIAFCRLMHGVSVRSDAPWKTFQEFIEYAKKNPGKIKFATYSPNSTTFFMMNLLAKDRQIDWIHVPYKSDGQAATALLGGHVEAIAVASGQVPYIKSGQIRLLAIFNRKRFSEFPDVPTVPELGYDIPNLSDRTTLTGIVAPKGLSGEPLAKLTSAFKKAFQEEAFKKMMRELSCPIEILESKEYEKEVNESYQVAQKVYPDLLKEIQKK